MKTADLPDILRIEQAGQPFPWTEGIFKDCLTVGYHCFVLEIDNITSGFAIMSIQGEECHILNIGILQNKRRQGFGLQLMQYLLELAKTQHADMIFLEVRASNQAALHLYRQLGFNEIGLRKDYYQATNGREDAILFGLQL